jgi:hypothetical protein
MIGIIGVDPGVTTGISWGLFNPALRDRTTLWNALARGRDLGCDQIAHPDDTFIAGLQVAERVSNLIAGWNIERGLGKSDIQVWCEDFEIRSNTAPGTKLASVFIAGMLYGALSSIGWGENLHFVKAGVHKPLGTDARLKRLARASHNKAGWVPGKKHARDSWRVVAWGLDAVP